ncbi:unnamed protein product [Darwinula stevensoni]|uniref:Uncharacterized protein n=1 Tax=Darwinula stevensoni TaxID=69355 RepID=A0A7R9AEI2_9CRUS|nr:unnamed protein product [Darwinula stevensoni]CAG0902065.1 unnamed protein product [Darwinula stevensoni]
MARQLFKQWESSSEYRIRVGKLLKQFFKETDGGHILGNNTPPKNFVPEELVEVKDQEQATVEHLKGKSLLPNLSPALLGGIQTDSKERFKMSSDLKAELLRHLDNNSLLLSGNKTKLRWQYHELGRALCQRYPKLQWDEKEGLTQKYPWICYPIMTFYRKLYNFFISRLAARRRRARFRERHPAQKQRMKNTLDGSSLSVTMMHGVNMLMEVTFPKRRKEEALLYTINPNYLLVEETITCEVSRVMGRSVHGMEEKITCMLDRYRIEMPTAQLATVEKYLRSKGATEEVITMTCTIERAVAILVGAYYLKDLQYPSAFAQFLGLIQSVLKEDLHVPKYLMNVRLKLLMKTLVI